MLKLLSCEYINKLVDFYEDPEVNKAYMVLEYAGNKSLSQFIEEKKLQVMVDEEHEGPLFSEDFIQSIMKQLFVAVEYMQRNNICHRDLKPDNIILNVSNDVSFNYEKEDAKHRLNKSDY